MIVSPYNFKVFNVVVKDDVLINDVSLSKGMNVLINTKGYNAFSFLPFSLFTQKKSYEFTKKYKKEIIEGFKMKYEVDLSRNWEIYRVFFIVGEMNNFIF